MAVLGQFWYVIEGGADGSAPHNDDYSDARLVYINDDGTNHTTLVDNTPTTDLVTGFPEEVALDTAAGLYYVLVDGFQGVDAKLLMGHIGSTAAPTTVFTFDPTFAGTENNLAFGLHLDPINHNIYIGYVEFNPNFDAAHQGIRQFSYNTSTGAVSGGGYIVTQTTASIQPSKAGSTALFAARDFDIDYTHSALYATVRAQGSGFETNTLVRLNLADPDGSPAVSLINQTLFTTNFAVNPATAQNGFITDVEVDQASDRVFFVTHDQAPGGAHHEDDAIWVITSASTASNVTPTQVTLNGLPTPALFYPEDIVLDEVNNILYVETEQNDTSGPSDDLIYVFQLTSDTQATYIKTITPAALVGVANIGGMTFDELAVIASVNGTTTHAAEQGVNLTLLTGAPTITDFESDHLNNATVQITGGTFSSNENSTSDDHLTIASANRTGSDTSGTINGTNISYSYNSATEKLTLSGYDTFANYQTALTFVQFFTTGDNPTNYGNNSTRTISWQANDGAAGDPSGTPNGTTTNLRTTTLNIDAKNDAPVNNLPATPSVNEDVQTPITGISITDVDADPANQDITVAFSVLHGTLNVLTNVANGIIGADITAGAQNTNTITITATQNQINATIAGNGLRYTSDLNFNSGFATETLHIVTNDNSHTDSAAFPGAQTDTDNLTINVLAVNDNPNLQPDTTTAVSYTENAVPTALFAAENVDTPLGDVDQSANYSGGSIDLNITAGLVTGDRIDLMGSRFVIVGGNIQDTANGNAVVGTIGATNATSHVTVSALTSAATPSVVDALLKSFGFDSTSDNPGGGDRTVTLTFNDGGNTGSGAGLTDAVTQTVHVIPVNDAPVSTITPTTYSATEQVNLTLKNNGLAVSDVDGNSGNETITLSVTEGTLTVTVGDSGVTVDSGNSTSSVVVSGTLTQLNALLGAGGTSNLVYNDPSDTPAASATLTLLIHDNGNTGTPPPDDLSASDTATINITAVNDAPNASMTTDPYAATENVALNIKNTGMSVSDVDALGGVEVATLSVTQGILNVFAGTSGATVGGDGTNSVTLTGTLAQINALLNTDLASSVSYTETNDNPSATVTLTLAINDQGNTGTPGAQSGSDTSTINITAVNDAPVATITPLTYSATEQVALNLKNNGLAVSDVDGNAGSETVTLSVTEGTLTVTAGSSGAVVNNSGSSSVTITGTIAQINDLLNTNGTSTVSYTDNTNTPSASATLTLAINDNGNTSSPPPNPLSANDTATILITAVNDAPVVAPGGPLVYTENDPASGIMGGGGTVADVDSADFNGGSLTVSFGANARAADQLSVLTDATILLNGTTVQYDADGAGGNPAVDIGTITTNGANGANLVVSLNTANATPTSVTALIQHVAYANSSDNPVAELRLVTFSVNDGDGAANGGGDTGSTSANLTVVAKNDAPVSTITPTEYDGSPNVAINLKNNGLSVSDVDGNNGSETVTLSVTSGTLTVTAGTSGAGVAGSGSNSVQITGTIAQINDLLNTNGTSTVSYVDSVGGTKTLTLAINDNGNTGTPPPGAQSAQDTANIVLDVPPVVDLNGGDPGTGATLAYTENAAATAIAPAGVTTDVDSADFNGGVLRVAFSANGAAEDQLSILTDGTVTVSSGTVSVGGLAIGTVSGGANGTDLLISFNTTNATPSSVSTLIEHIGYANNSDNPSTATRSVTFLVDDGDGASGTANATINITPANDAPVATITPASYSATENVALSLKNNGLAVSDIDGNAGSETVTLSVGEGTLNVTAGGSGAVVTNSGTSSVTITGTLAQINALLNTDGTSTVSYTDGNDNPAASTTLTLAIDDNGNTGGGNLTANDTATINITPANDAPVATITPASYSATENVALSLKNNGLAVSDIDGNAGGETVTLSVGEGTLNVTAGGSGAVVTNSGTSSVTITGTLAQINALLNTDGTSTVSYTDGNDNPAASTTLTLAIDDNGNTGGGNLTANDTATINITPANDAPVATITPTTYAATEQTSLSLKNNGLAVSDVDGNAGSETVTLSVTEGTLTVTAGGSGAGVAGSGTASVTITGTIAQINALLNTDATSTVSYSDNTDTPGASTTLTLAINDNGNTGGGNLTGNDTATINIAAVNDAPVVNQAPSSVNYTENAAATAVANFPPFDPGALFISDVDSSQINSVTVAITSGFVFGDQLDVDVTGFGVTVNYDDVNGILTVDGALNTVNYTHILDTLTFFSTSDNPGTSRTITWTVTDVGSPNLTSAPVTTTIAVTQVNDAPVAAITPTSYSATEQTALNLKNNGLAVSDVDGNAGSETVTLSVTEGTLTVTTGGSGAGVAGSGTASVTITGTIAQINALLNTDGTSTVSYIDNTDTPGVSTTLSLLIHDNGNTGTGGDLSSTDTATINITAVNDAPQLTGFGDSSSFVENGGAALLDTVQNASVSDAELNVSPNKYAGATLTIARTGGPNADDSFVGTGSLDLADVSGTGENVSLDGGTTFIGTFTNPGDGSFSITFNANATAADVNSVMRQIAYSNGSDNPPTSVQVDFTLSDGNGQPGGQAQGTGPTPGTTTASFTVNITQVDDAPVLINVAPSAAYSPGSAGVVLSSGLGVFDVDATPPSTLQGIASATVSISSGFFAGDQLFVNLPTSGGFFIVDDGSGPVVTNISVTSNAAGTMVLGGTDTTQHYQDVLDAVNYRSTAADPSNGGADPSRTIEWRVNDGALNSQTPNPDPNNLVNATILHFDTAPAVDLDASGPGTGFTTTFTENGAAIAIADTDLSITDPDTANLDSATIVLNNAKAGDVLSIAGTLPAGIDSTIDTSVAGQITLRLINSASLADYQTAVGQVRFSNSSDAPDATDRDVTVFVSESGGIDSNVAHATVHVVAVNDAPVNTVPGGPLNISPTTGNVTITGLSIADPDAGSGTMSTILTVGHGTLTVSAAGGATVLGSGSNAVTVTGTLSALNATLLASGNVLYHADTGFTGVDTLKMTTNDGGNSGIGGPLTDIDQVFINDIGQGALAPNGQLPGTIQGPGVLVYRSPVDFNHDGNGDLLLRHTSGPLAAWELNGPVKIADQVISPLGNDWHVAAKNDFNGDGKTDILLRHDNGTIALWTMNGTQKAADQIVSPLGNDWHVAATNDFNGDGKSDILLRHDNGTIALWTMNGATKVADQVVSALGNDWHITDTADFNGDGKSDILLRHDNGTVALWTMNGATKVADQVIGPQANDWHFLATADFNGDGKADILWRNDNGSVELWTMNGASKIADQVVSQMGNDWHYLGVGDFNADGKADILWRHDNGTVAVWEMNNGQKLADQVVSPLGNDWHFAALTDANNDHMTDILWRHDDGTVALWQMNGTHKQVDQVVSHLGNDWVLT